MLLAAAGCTTAKDGRAVADSSTSARTITASTITARTEGGRTRLEMRTGTAAARVLLVDRDSAVSPDAEPREASVAGELPGAALVVVDAYPSAPLGMSLCQAGEERFLRVIALAAAQPVETYRVKVASCRANVELGSRGIEWRADSSLVRIHWLSGPGAGHAAESRTLRIGRDGGVRASTP